MTDDRFTAALSLLDAEIAVAEGTLADAESALADLKLKRQGAEAFLVYLDNVPTSPEPVGTMAPSGQAYRGEHVPGASPSSVVERIVKANSLTDFNTVTLQRLIAEDGIELTKDQITNGLSYLSRKGIVEKRAKRGDWRYTGGSLASNAFQNSNGPTEVRPFALASAPGATELKTG
jgi:DNA-binding transcriptional ArsR family regulator